MMVERNGRSGRGPSQRSQSRPGGGGESGAWPIPPVVMLLVKAARATVTLPSAPECTASASWAYIRDDRRWTPTWTIRSCFRAAFDHRAALDDRHRQRLLDVDVLAGPAGGDHLDGVPVVGRRDHDGVDVLAIEHRAEVLDPRDLALDRRHLGDPLAQPGEPGIDPVIGPVQVGLIDVAQGDDLGVGMRQEALQELAAAIADADEAQPDPFVGPQHAARRQARGGRGRGAAVFENARRLTPCAMGSLLRDAGSWGLPVAPMRPARCGEVNDLEDRMRCLPGKRYNRGRRSARRSAMAVRATDKRAVVAMMACRRRSRTRPRPGRARPRAGRGRPERQGDEPGRRRSRRPDLVPPRRTARDLPVPDLRRPQGGVYPGGGRLDRPDAREASELSGAGCRKVDLARERGDTEQLKIGSVIHRELLIAAAEAGVFLDAPIRIGPGPSAGQGRSPGVNPMPPAMPAAAIGASSMPARPLPFPSIRGLVPREGLESDRLVESLMAEPGIQQSA